MAQLYIATQHRVHNQTVSITGDSASGETYSVAEHLSLIDGRKSLLTWAIRYQDRWKPRAAAMALHAAYAAHRLDRDALAQNLNVDSNRLVSVCAIPAISRIRASTRSKPSRLSARSSATMSQRPLVL